MFSIAVLCARDLFQAAWFCSLVVSGGGMVGRDRKKPSINPSRCESRSRISPSAFARLSTRLFWVSMRLFWVSMRLFRASMRLIKSRMSCFSERNSPIISPARAIMAMSSIVMVQFYLFCGLKANCWLIFTTHLALLPRLQTYLFILSPFDTISAELVTNFTS